MNIELTPGLEEMVRQKVGSGLYASASEVVCEALRFMGEQERRRNAGLEKLREDIRAGVKSGSASVWQPDQVKQDSRLRRGAWLELLSNGASHTEIL